MCIAQEVDAAPLSVRLVILEDQSVSTPDAYFRRWTDLGDAPFFTVRKLILLIGGHRLHDNVVDIIKKKFSLTMKHVVYAYKEISSEFTNY